MAKKNKTYTYPKSVTIKNDKGETVFTVATNLYDIGVYVIENNDPRSQFGLKPSQMPKYMKQFENDNLHEGYESTFGPSITVGEVDGFYKEIK